MRAEIITIGDELLIGQVVNTNQAFIAERLNAAGVRIERMTTVGDDRKAILKAFQSAWETADIVIVTGGLGPTHDDITKNALCEFFHVGLVPSPEVRNHIESLLATRNIQWSAAAEGQTLVPEQCRVLENPVGTAPGLLHESHGKLFAVLPGVPHEMRAIVEGSLVRLVKARTGGTVIRHKTLCATGIGESLIASRLGNIDAITGGASLAFLPSPFGVRLRISIEAQDQESADTAVTQVEERIRAKVGKYIYGVDDEHLEEVVGKILKERSLTIAVAESCTGGLIADRLTNISGSSVYFERGLITYSNRSKIEMLGVPGEMLSRYGAVSREVSEAMAAGVRHMAGTDLGLSTTGIAGPTGGSPEKPVGLVWIGIADRSGTLAMKFTFGSGRMLVKQRASQAALELVRRRVMRIEG